MHTSIWYMNQLGCQISKLVIDPIEYMHDLEDIHIFGPQQRATFMVTTKINERRNIFNTFVFGQLHQEGEQAHLLEQCYESEEEHAVLPQKRLES